MKVPCIVSKKELKKNMNDLEKRIVSMLIGIMLGLSIVLTVELKRTKTDIYKLENKLSEARDYHLELNQKLRVIDIKLEMLKYSKEND